MTSNTHTQVFAVPNCLWKAHAAVMEYSFEDHGYENLANACKRMFLQASAYRSPLEDTRTWAGFVQRLASEILRDPQATHMHAAMQVHKASLGAYHAASNSRNLLKVHEYIMQDSMFPDFWEVTMDWELKEKIARSACLADLFQRNAITDHEVHEWGLRVWCLLLYVNDTAKKERYAALAKAFINAHLME